MSALAQRAPADAEVLKKLIRQLRDTQALLEGTRELRAPTSLGGEPRNQETLVDHLISLDGLGGDLALPLKATLSRTYLLTKINFLRGFVKATTALETQSPEFHTFSHDLREELGQSIYTLLGEELFLALLRKPDIEVRIKRRAADKLITVWDDAHLEIDDFAPMLESAWHARNRINSDFGCLVGAAETFRLVCEDCSPEVLEFFMGLGIPVYELYGMTENAAVATCNFDGRIRLGTVGEPYPGIDFRIDEQTGEIQTRHPGVFAGYWNKPEKTAETFTADGWLKTGDVGVWVDGTHVKIIDRIKDIIITSGGKNVSPSEIENSLKASPYIKEAMVVGDRRRYLTALVGIEYETVGNWALRRGIPYTTYRDLSEKPEVIELIQKVVEATNAKFSTVEQIKKFRMIPKELDHEDGELTATQKLKRSAMVDMFGDLVESMY